MRLQILTVIALAALSCCQRNEPMANEPWASDLNYPAGADPWSGTPTKSAPGLSEIAAGHVPGAPDPAEVENWWKNRADSRLAVMESYFVAGDIVLPVDKSVVISGAGKYKRGNKKRPLSVLAGRWMEDNVAGRERYFANGAPFFTSIQGGGGWGSFGIPLVVEQDERIKAVDVVVTNAATDVLKLELWKVPQDNSGASKIGATQTSTNHVNSPELLAVTGLAELVDGTASYHLLVYCTAYANNPSIIGASQTTDVP